MVNATGADGNDRPPRRLQTCHVDDLLFLLTRIKGASDLHLAVGLPPVVSVEGKLMQAPYELVTAETSKRLLYGILNEQQVGEFEAGKALDFIYSAHRIADFRVNVFRDKGTVAAAFRTVKPA